MNTLRRVGKRLRWLLVISGVLASGATALAVAQPASATYEPYSCSSCESKNGPNLVIKNTQGVNYTEHGVCTADWRYNGGSSYTVLDDECSTGTYEVYACYSGSQYTGHGEVEDIAIRNEHLAGHEDNYASCG
jgi:hypothetical protein